MVSRQFDNECLRCAGRGVIAIRKGPSIPCSCPAGRVMAHAITPVHVVAAVEVMRRG